MKFRITISKAKRKRNKKRPYLTKAWMWPRLKNQRQPILRLRIESSVLSKKLSAWEYPQRVAIMISTMTKEMRQNTMTVTKTDKVDRFSQVTVRW